MKHAYQLFLAVCKHVKFEGLFCNKKCSYYDVDDKWCDLFQGLCPDERRYRPERREACKKIFGITTNEQA